VDRIDSAGVDGIRQVDGAFDAGIFTAWAGSVYQRAVAAWRDKSPELLRPVMTQEVWNEYALYLLTASRVALAQKLMGSARATASLAGAAVDGATHSVVVSFEVATTAPETAAVDPETTHWHERWLFERPAHYRTHASGAVAVCPVCGAPADPGESGECRYCHSDITTRTAGWLVTQTATNMKGAVRLARHRAEQVIERGGISLISTNDHVSESAVAGDLPAQPAPAGTPLQPPRSGTPLQPPRAGTPIQPPRAGTPIQPPRPGTPL
jgi:hypothetical protein